MHFFIAVIDDATGLASSDEMAAITEFNGRLRADGHWVMAAGLAPPSGSTVIDSRRAHVDERGDSTVTSGPFLDSRDYVSGFWIIDAPDHQAALALAIEASACCNRRVELRPFLAG